MISRSLLCLCLAAAGVAAPRVNFDRDVRPILSDHCFTCHGPDEKQRMAGLRLDTQEGVETVAKTRLLARLTHAKPALRMPPPSTGRTLTDKQIGVIRQWIEEGAG